MSLIDYIKHTLNHEIKLDFYLFELLNVVIDVLQTIFHLPKKWLIEYD